MNKVISICSLVVSIVCLVINLYIYSTVVNPTWVNNTKFVKHVKQVQQDQKEFNMPLPFLDKVYANDLYDYARGLSVPENSILKNGRDGYRIYRSGIKNYSDKKLTMDLCEENLKGYTVTPVKVEGTSKYSINDNVAHIEIPADSEVIVHWVYYDENKDADKNILTDDVGLITSGDFYL